jgi:hypothetical protein
MAKVSSNSEDKSEDLVMRDRVSMRLRRRKPEDDGNNPAGSGWLQLGSQVSDDDSNFECVFFALVQLVCIAHNSSQGLREKSPMQVGIHRVKYEASVAHRKRAYLSTNSSACAGPGRCTNEEISINISPRYNVKRSLAKRTV